MLDVSGFWIMGDWDRTEPPDDRPVIRLAPHPKVFGTGTHVTTSAILAKLHDLIRPEMTVMDIGAGTGIVLFAAGKLGAGKLIAVERDENAIAALVTNSKINLIDLDIRRGPLEEMALDHCDLAVCNTGTFSTMVDVLDRTAAPTLILAWMAEWIVVLESSLILYGWNEIERIHFDDVVLSVLER